MGVYLKQLKEKRKRQLREIAFNLIKKSVNNIIEIEYNTLWNKVQPFFLCVLARRRNRKIAIEGKKARENYSKIIVMEMFQMKMLFYKINKFREGNKKIRQFSITQLSTRYFIKMRESSFIIQAYLKRYKEMIKSRNEIISQYFSSDIGEKKSNEKLMEKCLFPLFTNIKKLSQSSSSCSLSYAKKKYPGKKIILASHSFGSFVAQYVIENHGQEIDKAILMGTAGPRNALVRGGLLVAALVRAFKGSKYVSPLINELSFGSYNARYKNPRTEFDWISSDPSSVDLYMMDKMCGFGCSCGFMYDLLCGFLNIHSKAGLRKVPSDLPVFICCGKDDPVGSYGKTVKKLADAYRKNGVKDVTLKIYDGMRHELLNDRCRYEVIEELVKFMKD